MARKKKVRIENNNGTALQIIPRKRRHGGHNAKGSLTRRKFIMMFERTAGNITAACTFAGIGRRTYYRWIESKTPENLKFQKNLSMIKAPEVLKDIAESVILFHLGKNSLSAAKFVLDRVASDRGWSDKPKEEKKLNVDLSNLKKTIQLAADKSGWSYDEELKWFMENIAETYKPELIEKLRSDMEQ